MKTDHWIKMTQPQKFALPVLGVLLACCLGSCERAGEVPPGDSTKINGNTIVFSPDSPLLKNIQTVKVEAPRERELQVPGRLVWDEDHTVRIFTPFAGRVTRIHANVGDRVNASQALAELTSPDFGQAQADARKAQADLTAKTAQLSRMKELAAAGVAAGKDLQQAESDQHSADAEFRRATARLSLFGDANIVDQRFVLKSPIPGVVVERTINPGQELRPDQPTAPQFVVTDPTKLWVQLDASETDLKSLKTGTAIILTSSQFPDDTFAAELRQVADFIDPVTRSLKLRGTVKNTDRRLKAEMFVTARIVMPKGDSPMIAEKAVFLDGVRSFAFVKTAAGSFARRSVRVGPSYGNAMPVLAGLKEGDEAVVSGSLYLQQMLAAAGIRAEAADAGAPEVRK